ncbi:MAG: hypothetical protein NUV65_06310 [Candidatus Roizmanbacteria bacterium]|nr:hypothetical protein [Candidatus Roizmanbacteria bacterium]
MTKKITDSALTFEEYKKLVSANLTVLSHYPNNCAFFDYTRTDLARKAYKLYKKRKLVPKLLTKGYLSCAILPTDISDMSIEQFKALRGLYGDALTRLRLIDDNFFKHLKNATLENVLNTGGACAIESTDTKILNTFRNKKRPDLIIPYIKEIAKATPTWSQITGALVAMRGVNVMYDETYPWYLRFEQYGITGAEKLVKQIYDGIYSAVVRYAKLQNPESTVIRIPFTDLNLENDGSLRELYELYKENIRSIGLDKKNKSVFIYNSDLNKKMWVEYTYRGPRILEKLKGVLQKKYPKVFDTYNINKAALHIRSKQIDHLTIERQDSWLCDIVLNGSSTNNQMKNRKITHLLKMYNKVHGLGLLMWFKDNYSTVPVGFAGMLDFVYEGSMVHEYPRKTLLEDVLQGKAPLQSLTDSVFRPNAANIKKVILFLKKYTYTPKLTVSKDTLSNIDRLISQEKKLLNKINNLNLLLFDFELYNRLWMRYRERVNGKNQLVKQVTINTFYYKNIHGSELFRSLVRRYKYDHLLIPSGKNKDDEWRRKAESSLGSFLSKITITHENQAKIEFSMMFNTDDDVFGDKLYDLVRKEFVIDKDYLNKLKGELADVRNSINSIVTKIEISVPQLELLSNKEPVHILPLADNYFVSFMQQFLFVPSIRTAYIELTVIEQEKGSIKEKEEKITKTCQKVFPIIEKLLLYVFKGGVYPHQERYSV